MQSAQLQRQGAPAQPAEPSQAPKEIDIDIEDDALKRLPAQAKDFLHMWHESAGVAMGSTENPADPCAAGYAWLALAGNMVWAVTSLSVLATGPLGAAAKAGVIGGSHAGALGGSGALGPGGVLGPPTVENGRKQIGVKLSQAYSNGVAKIDEVVKRVADRCADEHVADHTQQDQMLWTEIIGGYAPLNDAGAITAHLQGLISATLSWVVAQYLEWDKEIQRCQIRPYQAQPPGGPPAKSREECEKENPFRPTFSQAKEGAAGQAAKEAAAAGERAQERR